jgi:hypothetical protein
MTVLLLHPMSARKEAVPMIRSSSASARPRRGEASEFRLIFMVSFAIFLMVAVIERVLPSSWRSHALGHDGGKSIFGEARSAAHTFVPFAFMG